MKLAVLGMNNPTTPLKQLRERFIAAHINEKPVKPTADNPAAMHLYQEQKASFQLRWMQYLEEDLYDSITQALERCRAASLPDTLFVILLPEGYFADLEWDAVDVYGAHYMNPFYEPTVRNFLAGAISGPKSLASLANGNVMICAGTIWWKEPHTCGDVFFNSTATFFNGSLVHMWDKQLLASVDPLGSKDTTYRKWTTYRETKLGIAHMTDRTELGLATLQQIQRRKREALVLSDLTQRHCSEGTDLFHIEFCGRDITFATEICADHINEVYKHIETRKPDIRICVAYDMNIGSINPLLEQKNMKHYMLICDGHNGNHVVEQRGVAHPKLETLAQNTNDILRSYTLYLLDL